MTIKPFCVKSEELTDNDLNLMLEKCVENGAWAFNWVDTDGDADCIEFHNKDEFKYWGVDYEGDTVTSDSLLVFEDHVLTKDQAFNMLGINHAKDQDQDCVVSKIEKFFDICQPEKTVETQCMQIGVKFEEVAEFMAAIGLHQEAIDMHFLADNFKTKEDFAIELTKNANLVEMTDACCDEIVTNVGIMKAFVVPVKECLNEVGDSNLSKFEDGKVLYDENGKTKKGKGYFKPNLAKIIGIENV